MIEEDSTLDDDVAGMLARVSSQHSSFRNELKAIAGDSKSGAEAKMNTLAMVEIAHQLAYSNTLKGIELLIQLESIGEEEEEEGEASD